MCTRRPCQQARSSTRAQMAGASRACASAPLPEMTSSDSDDQGTLERPSLVEVVALVSACCTNDMHKPSMAAMKTLLRSVEGVAESSDELVLGIASGLRKCLEEEEPPAPGSGSCGNGSYRVMKALVLTIQLVQQQGASGFRVAATQQLQSVVSALAHGAPADVQTSTAGIPAQKVRETATRLLCMLKDGVTSKVNRGEFKVAPRSSRNSDMVRALPPPPTRP